MSKGRRPTPLPREIHQYQMDMRHHPDMSFLFDLTHDEQTKYHIYVLHEGYCGIHVGRLCNCHADVDLYKKAETEDGEPTKIAELHPERNRRGERIQPIRVVSFRQGG